MRTYLDVTLLSCPGSSFVFPRVFEKNKSVTQQPGFAQLGRTFNCAVCLEFFPQGKQDLNTSIDLLEGELCNNYYCVQQETYYLCHFSFTLVSSCPVGIDRRCLVISDFDCHLGPCDTLCLDLMLYRSNGKQDEFRLSQAALLYISKVRGYDHVGQPKKKPCKYKLQSNKTHQTHFLNQHFQIPI